MYTAQNGFEKGFAGATPGIYGDSHGCGWVNRIRSKPFALGSYDYSEAIRKNSGRAYAGLQASSSYRGCSTWASSAHGWSVLVLVGLM